MVIAFEAGAKHQHLCQRHSSFSSLVILLRQIGNDQVDRLLSANTIRASRTVRIELNCPPPLSDKQLRDLIEGGPRKMAFSELGEPRITLLYEVPEDASQFELQHHSLRHTFTLANGGETP